MDATMEGDEETVKSLLTAKAVEGLESGEAGMNMENMTLESKAWSADLENTGGIGKILITPGGFRISILDFTPPAGITAAQTLRRRRRAKRKRQQKRNRQNTVPASHHILLGPRQRFAC